MSAPTTNVWLVQELTELLVAAVRPDGSMPVEYAADRIAEALDAEVAAVVTDGEITHVIGISHQAACAAGVAQIEPNSRTTAHLPDLGAIEMLGIPIDEGRDVCMVIGRFAHPFDVEETSLLRAMGATLTLTTRLSAVAESERRARQTLESRQRLLERLASIQHAIAHRVPAQDVLDAVTAAALDLLGSTSACLRIHSDDYADRSLIVSHQGPDLCESQLGILREIDSRSTIEFRTEDSVTLIAPIWNGGVDRGWLIVGTEDRKAGHSDQDRQVLETLAEHAAVVLNDAETQEALQAALSSAVHQANHDELTGLPNRTAALAYLESARQRSAGWGDDLLALFVDLDHFKHVNDLLGHALGDEVLRIVADRLVAAARPEDVVARLGGDEFLVIGERTSLEESLELAERLMRSVRRPVWLGDRSHTVSCSIGIASWHDSQSPAGLIENADLAMYRAKQAGRGQIEVFDRGLRTELVRRHVLSEELRSALAVGQLEVHYQAIIHLPTGLPVGTESLVRWQHPDRGLVPPNEFIPVAEDVGLIGSIDRAVLFETVRQLSQWTDLLPMGEPSVAGINLSTQTLSDPDIVRDIEAALAANDVEPSRIWLEITESLLVTDSDEMLRRLADLRALGVWLSVDDFGTGYSSLSYLHSFPVNAVKIDRSFVRGLGRNERSEAIVTAITHMAGALGLVVVAEGIETKEQLDCLLALTDADMAMFGQGFLFGRAVTAGEAGPALWPELREAGRGDTPHPTPTDASDLVPTAGAQLLTGPIA